MTETDHTLLGNYVFPASSSQERLWFLREFDSSEGAAYHLHGGFLVESVLDRLVLQRSLNLVVARHEALRTRFAHHDGRLVQVVTPGAQITLSVVDVDASDPDTGWAELHRISEREAKRPFSLQHGPLLRATLVRLPAVGEVVLVTLHHIVADGWSISVLLSELAECYRALGSGEQPDLGDLPLQYADYTVWQKEWEDGADFAHHREYWRTRLAGVPLVLDLPADRPRPPMQTFRGATVELDVPADLLAVLHAMARSRDVTLFMLLLSGFQALIGRYTGSTDFLVGTPVSNRGREELTRLVGFFANTLVLRADLSGDPTVAELVARTRACCLDDFEHQRFPFERLVDELRPDRMPSRNPVFQVLFALEEDILVNPTFGDLRLRRLDEVSDTGTAKFDLSVFVVTERDQARLRLEYSTDLFDTATVERLAGHYLTMLAGFAQDPTRRVGEVGLLSDGERAEILVAASGPTIEVTHPPLPLMVGEQAAKTPDALAVSHRDGAWTYHKLDEQANRIAHRLIASGVTPGSRVGVCLARTPLLIAALLGILKAGATYVPLDPRYPARRNATILLDARPTLVLTTEDLNGIFPEDVRVAALDREPLLDEPVTAPGVTVDPRGLAYILYTSGSTGTPKGVAIEHRSASNLVSWAHTEFSAAETAGTLAVTSICFDLSVFEIFTPLTRGGTVVLVDDPLDVIADDPLVTLINTVPSAIAELLHRGGIPPNVATINLAGEPLTGQLIRRLHAETGATRVVNLYGPSETTTYSTFTDLPPDAVDPVLIGHPVANTRAYVLDRDLHLMPPGVQGELFLAGTGLARGYHNRAEHTADRFLPNPFAVVPGERLYRTGDLVRWHAHGGLEFLGRTDHQIKLRGYRIELGDVESALRGHPDVLAAIVHPQSHDGPSARRLVAYVVPRTAVDGEALARALRDHVLTLLPGFMVPAGFVFLDRMPLTPNGKVDRAALAAREDVVVAKHRFVAPRDRTETYIADLWAALLGQDRVGAYDNFFDLGGNSLIAARMVQDLRARYRMAIPLREVFVEATVANLASVIEENRRAVRTVDSGVALLDEMDDDEFDALLNAAELDIVKEADR